MTDTELSYFRQLTVEQLKSRIKEKVKELVTLETSEKGSYESLRSVHLIHDLELIGRVLAEKEDCNISKQKLVPILDFQNTVIDFIEDNKLCVDCVKIALYGILGAIYSEEFIEKPECGETIIENIERSKEIILQNIFGEK